MVQPFVVPQAVERVGEQVVVADQVDPTIVVVLVFIKHVEPLGEGRLALLSVRGNVLIEQFTLLSL